MTPVRSHPPRRTRRAATHTLWRLDWDGGPAVTAPVTGAPADDAVDLSHTDLLSLARAVQAAAIADDVAELTRVVERLQQGLRRHVESERSGQAHLTPTLRAVVFGGQDRLLRLVDAFSSEAHGDPEWVWVRRGAELAVALRRQAALEAAALAHVNDDV